ncbi:MAG: nitrate reductase molybdenum cofactor assembly chaperone [Xanthobacteraceae bacterium]
MTLVTPAFKVLSALLTYPTPELAAAGGEIAAALAGDDTVPEASRRALTPLIDELAAGDIYEMQERYVDLFDKTRRLSLHLFEHVHGESRDRGQAMVDLASLYDRGGLMLTANELPDYLPLFLEYLALRPREEAKALLAEIDHILAPLEERLGARGSPYAAVFTAIRAAAGATTQAQPVDAADEPDDLAVLDADWEETAVTFGPGEALDGCSVDRLRTQMRAARRDARQMRT